MGLGAETEGEKVGEKVGRSGREGGRMVGRRVRDGETTIKIKFSL